MKNHNFKINTMDLKGLLEPLRIESVEFRMQSVNKGGYATILAYKDARVDMTVLDNVVGACNWKREHSRDNKNCTVSIWCSEKKEWVGKEDTGQAPATQSVKEKGLASDSFKRACFNWGIGRELYDYPVMSLKLKNNEWEKYKDPNGNEKVRTTWDFRLKEWTWVVKFNDKNQVTLLTGIDQHGDVRFSFEEGVTQQMPSYPVANFKKAAKFLKGGGNWAKIEKEYFVSAAAKEVIESLKSK